MRNIASCTARGATSGRSSHAAYCRRKMSQGVQVNVKYVMMKHRTVLWRSASICVLIGLLTLAAQEPRRFVGRVVDGETGRPVAASVVVKNASGYAVEIEGDHAHVQYLQQRWCYVDGEFLLSGGSDGYSVAIRRGLETLPVRQTIDSGASERLE